MSMVKVIQWPWLEDTRVEFPSKFQTSSPQKAQGQFQSDFIWILVRMFALIIYVSGSLSAMILRWVLQGHHGSLVCLFYQMCFPSTLQECMYMYFSNILVLEVGLYEFEELLTTRLTS